MKNALLKLLWGTLENVVPLLAQLLIEAAQRKKNAVGTVIVPPPSKESTENFNTNNMDVVAPATPSL